MLLLRPSLTISTQGFDPFVLWWSIRSHFWWHHTVRRLKLRFGEKWRDFNVMQLMSSDLRLKHTSICLCFVFICHLILFHFRCMKYSYNMTIWKKTKQNSYPEHIRNMQAPLLSGNCVGKGPFLMRKELIKGSDVRLVAHCPHGAGLSIPIKYAQRICLSYSHKSRSPGGPSCERRERERKSERGAAPQRRALLC